MKYSLDKKQAFSFYNIFFRMILYNYPEKDQIEALKIVEQIEEVVAMSIANLVIGKTTKKYTEAEKLRIFRDEIAKLYTDDPDIRKLSTKNVETEQTKLINFFNKNFKPVEIETDYKPFQNLMNNLKRRELTTNTNFEYISDHIYIKRLQKYLFDVENMKRKMYNLMLKIDEITDETELKKLDKEYKDLESQITTAQRKFTQFENNFFDKTSVTKNKEKDTFLEGEDSDEDLLDDPKEIIENRKTKLKEKRAKEKKDKEEQEKRFKISLRQQNMLKDIYVKGEFKNPFIKFIDVDNKKIMMPIVFYDNSFCLLENLNYLIPIFKNGLVEINVQLTKLNEKFNIDLYKYLIRQEEEYNEELLISFFKSNDYHRLEYIDKQVFADINKVYNIDNIELISPRDSPQPEGTIAPVRRSGMNVHCSNTKYFFRTNNSIQQSKVFPIIIKESRPIQSKKITPLKSNVVLIGRCPEKTATGRTKVKPGKYYGTIGIITDSKKGIITQKFDKTKDYTYSEAKKHIEKCRIRVYFKKSPLENFIEEYKNMKLSSIGYSKASLRSQLDTEQYREQLNQRIPQIIKDYYNNKSIELIAAELEKTVNVSSDDSIKQLFNNIKAKIPSIETNYKTVIPKDSFEIELGKKISLALKRKIAECYENMRPSDINVYKVKIFKNTGLQSYIVEHLKNINDTKKKENPEYKTDKASKQRYTKEAVEQWKRLTPEEQQKYNDIHKIIEIYEHCIINVPFDVRIKTDSKGIKKGTVGTVIEYNKDNTVKVKFEGGVKSGEYTIYNELFDIRNLESVLIPIKSKFSKIEMYKIIREQYRGFYGQIVSKENNNVQFMITHKDSENKFVDISDQYETFEEYKTRMISMGKRVTTKYDPSQLVDGQGHPVKLRKPKERLIEPVKKKIIITIPVSYIEEFSPTSKKESKTQETEFIDEQEELIEIDFDEDFEENKEFDYGEEPEEEPELQQSEVEFSKTTGARAAFTSGYSEHGITAYVVAGKGRPLTQGESSELEKYIQNPPTSDAKKKRKVTLEKMKEFNEYVELPTKINDLSDKKKLTTDDKEKLKEYKKRLEELRMYSQYIITPTSKSLIDLVIQTKGIPLNERESRALDLMNKNRTETEDKELMELLNMRNLNSNNLEETKLIYETRQEFVEFIRLLLKDKKSETEQTRFNVLSIRYAKIVEKAVKRGHDFSEYYVYSNKLETIQNKPIKKTVKRKETQLTFKESKTEDATTRLKYRPSLTVITGSEKKIQKESEETKLKRIRDEKYEKEKKKEEYVIPTASARNIQLTKEDQEYLEEKRKLHEKKTKEYTWNREFLKDYPNTPRETLHRGYLYQKKHPNATFAQIKTYLDRRAIIL